LVDGVAGRGFNFCVLAAEAIGHARLTMSLMCDLSKLQAGENSQHVPTTSI
jgi:hypothetical protein